MKASVPYICFSVVLSSCTQELDSNPDAIWDELISTAEVERSNAERCHDAIHGWEDSWSLIEEYLVDLVNTQRAEGANCGSEGDFGPAGALEMQANIRCSARYHSYWMGDNLYYEHDSPGGDLGEDPWQRMEQAGFDGNPVGENVGFGFTTPGQAMDGWMSSDGHCANIMNPAANVIGIGYIYMQSSEYKEVWTQNFGYLADMD